MGHSPLSNIYRPQSKPVLLKEGAYIGANATILMGVTIGKCSIIGADALVKENIENFTMVAGVPAKFIKSTYEMIDK
jgi:acetyltransferase-like isoleucine patch superfamily enzyme